jgi:hypothetical protein
MKISFENIQDHVLSLDQSPFENWMVDAAKHNIPPAHIQLIQPLDKEAAKFLSDFISSTNLHAQVPFKKGFFRTVEKTFVQVNNQADIKKWLYRRGLKFDKTVYLSWQPDLAAIVPWKMIVKYSEEFAGGGDDLTIFDASLNWAILFYHEGDVFFATNENYEPIKPLSDEEFDSF